MSTKSAVELDEERKRNQAYEYLCHLEEAKKWLEYVLKKELPNSCDLEQHLRTAVDLALLASIVSPKSCPKNKIYDLDLKRFEERGLHYKHTDNIIMFIRACVAIGLPKVFHIETVDLYDAKNPVKVIFCIHALSHLLAKRGVFPLIKNLFGEIEFAEHEITRIQKYLENSGIRLPAFSKIGGILAGELSEDDAAVHAAIMLVSEALDLGDVKVLLERLKNPVLHFHNVHESNVPLYFEDMKQRKNKKVGMHEKRRPSQDEEDVYDKILSHAEIQDSINAVNIDTIVKLVNIALQTGDNNSLRQSFLSEDLGNIEAVSDNGDKYVDRALTCFKNNDNNEFTFTDVKNIVQEVNHEVEQTKNTLIFVNKLNVLLNKKDTPGLITLLKTPPYGFIQVDTERGELLVSYLNHIKELDGAFSACTLANQLKVLSSLIVVNKCIENQDSAKLFTELQNPDLHLTGLEHESALQYLSDLTKKRNQKELSLGSPNADLLLHEIEIVVNKVNQTVIEEMGKLEIISKINDCLDQATSDQILELLLNPKGKFKNVMPTNKDVYLQSFKHFKETLEGPDDGSQSIWHNNIQNLIDEYNPLTECAREIVEKIDHLNISLIDNNKPQLMHHLKLLNITGLIPECSVDSYFKALKNSLLCRSADHDWSGWLDHHICTPSKDFYYNHKTKQFTWFSVPSEYTANVGYLNSLMIQQVCNHVCSEYNRELYFKSNLESIFFLQSFHKTNSIYQGFKEHLNFVRTELPNLILIQSYLKTLKVYRYYSKCVERCSANMVDGCFLKFWAWTLIHVTNPSLKQICKHLNLLEFSDNDVAEEREVIRLKNLVHDKIIALEKRQEDLKKLDLSIGLLIKNRITLDETQSKSKFKRRKHDTEVSISSKEKIVLREKYGNIFYILQHLPIYAAKFLHAISLSHSIKFVRETFFSLLNYGSTAREEYLILCIFREAISYEVETEINSIKEFQKEDPAVVKLAISFYRDVKAPTFLQPMLSDPINEIMQIKGVINYNAREVYKSWLTQVETETEKTSTLPYDVTPEVALEHKEVQNILTKNIDIITTVAIKLRDSVINNRDFFPYGIRYIAKIIYESLNKKFPELKETGESLKIVGNILYYRFVNPATVSPESYDLLKGRSEVSSEQRKNLATISTILQNAATGKFSTSSIPIFKKLDDLMVDSFKRFNEFFESCIDVEPIEQHYNINEYSDITMFNQPEVKLTPDQIVNIHKLLLEHADLLFPDENDILLNLIKAIDTIPKSTDLIDRRTTTPVSTGKGDKHEMQQIETEEDILGSTIITIPLYPPKALLDTVENRNKELLARTIDMFVDILHFKKCETVTQVLESTFTDEEEDKYRQLLLRREQICNAKNFSSPTNQQEQLDVETKSTEDSLSFPTLNQTMQNFKENLKLLKDATIISPDNGYQDLLKETVMRIRARADHIKTRRRDLSGFRTTRDNLEAKGQFIENRIECYHAYIKGCVNNMRHGKSKKKLSVKRTAYQLYQSGILLGIDGQSLTTFKNIMMVFSSTDDPGKFSISCKFHDIPMLNYELEFQELLNSQFDNKNVIKLFNSVK
ncbi:hypothetical protein HZS_7263, partial [Henneguya salminicola]